jgi:hypothetical protein
LKANNQIRSGKKKKFSGSIYRRVVCKKTVVASFAKTEAVKKIFDF